MKELSCPKCGNVFRVDEEGYASIVSQVKTAEFEAEVSKRMVELSKQEQLARQAMAEKAEKKL